MALKRGVSFDTLPPGEGFVVRADPLRVSQLVGNLVGNAIKFTPAGGSVTLSAARDGARVLLQVADTGPGIPAADIPHLFDDFWQARTNDHRGVGLGLAIAKAVVESSRRQDRCDSTVGKGTTFSFTLPMATKKTG